jgi:hypothetical protein
MKSEYTHVKTLVRYITMEELTQLQNDYAVAQEKKYDWVIQAYSKVFDEIESGIIKVMGANDVSPRISTIGDLEDKWHKEKIQNMISNTPALAKAYGLID